MLFRNRSKPVRLECRGSVGGVLIEDCPRGVADGDRGASRQLIADPGPFRPQDLEGRLWP